MEGGSERERVGRRESVCRRSIRRTSAHKRALSGVCVLCVCICIYTCRSSLSA
jgi:hypothetical protein